MSVGISFRDKFRYLYERGISVTSIAARHNVSKDTVLQILHRNGFPHPKETLDAKLIVYEVEEPVARAIGYPRGQPRTQDDRDSRGHVAAHPPSKKIFCAQCDRLVYENEAAACRSQFCKAAAA